MLEEDRKRIPFLFSYVDALTMEESVQLIDRLLQARIPTQHVGINASKMVQMRDDKELTDIVNSSSIINADGQSVLWAAKVLKQHIPERVTGIDLMYRLLQLAAEKQYSVYLFGATEEVVTAAKQRFEEMYPALRIAGYHNGYFSADEEEEIAADMRSSGADIVFVALSSPQKEYWVRDNCDKIGIPFIMGVGGSFDVASGYVKRAPLWVQKAGFEWIYRFLQEPRRLFVRYTKGNWDFMRLVWKYRKQNKKKNKES